MWESLNEGRDPTEEDETAAEAPVPSDAGAPAPGTGDARA